MSVSLPFESAKTKQLRGVLRCTAYLGDTIDSALSRRQDILTEEFMAPFQETEAQHLKEQDLNNFCTSVFLPLSRISKCDMIH
jgi:hypothetical protein